MLMVMAVVPGTEPVSWETTEKKIGPQCVFVWLTKLSWFDGEGYKLKVSGLLLSFY